MPKDKPTPIAQPRWTYFVREFNENAERLSMPHIPTLHAILKKVPLLNEDAVVRMQIQFYESVIEHLDPLAESGFYYSKAQSRKAKQARDAKDPLHKRIRELISNPGYADFTNKELWEELIGSSKVGDLIIADVPGDELSLRWIDDSVDAAGITKGTLTFKAFARVLSDWRKKLRTGKYSNKELR